MTNMDFEEAMCAVLAETNFEYEIKEKQAEALKELVSHNNVFCILPTGYGKSLVYGFMPLVMDKMYPEQKHMALIISPLRALMAEQRARWENIGIPACAVTESNSHDPVADVLRGRYSLIFMTPEAALSNKWQDVMKKIEKNICLLALDEVHCMIEWGSTFRPMYKEVVSIRGILTNVPVCCLTATCTSSMQREICEVLGMEVEDYTHITAVPNRNNIYLEWDTKPPSTIRHLDWYIDRLKVEREHTPKCIVYCRNQQHQVDILGRVIQKIGVSSMFVGELGTPGQRLAETFFHGIGDQSEIDIPASFKNPHGCCRLLIATIAFGLGMDVPDVEFIVHWGPPSSFLDYWQEVGRAGRDGRNCKAIMYAPPHTIHKSRVTEDFYDSINNPSKCIRCMCLTALQVPGITPADIQVVCGGTQCCSVCSKLGDN